MRIIIASFLALIISFETFASSAKEALLADTVDDLAYSLTVDWDQKNETQYKGIILKFEKTLSEILKEKSLTSAEIKRIILTKIPDQKVTHELEQKLAMVPENEHFSFLQNLIVEQKQILGNRGASWNGDAIVPVGILVGSLALIVALSFLTADQGKDCLRYEEVEVYDTINGGYRWEGYCAEYALN